MNHTIGKCSKLLKLRWRFGCLNLTEETFWGSVPVNFAHCRLYQNQLETLIIWRCAQTIQGKGSDASQNSNKFICIEPTILSLLLASSEGTFMLWSLLRTTKLWCLLYAGFACGHFRKCRIYNVDYMQKMEYSTWICRKTVFYYPFQVFCK